MPETVRTVVTAARGKALPVKGMLPAGTAFSATLTAPPLLLPKETTPSGTLLSGMLALDTLL